MANAVEEDKLWSFHSQKLGRRRSAGTNGHEGVVESLVLEIWHFQGCSLQPEAWALSPTKIPILIEAATDWELAAAHELGASCPSCSFNVWGCRRLGRVRTHQRRVAIRRLEGLIEAWEGAEPRREPWSNSISKVAPDLPKELATELSLAVAIWVCL